MTLFLTNKANIFTVVFSNETKDVLVSKDYIRVSYRLLMLSTKEERSGGIPDWLSMICNLDVM